MWTPAPKTHEEFFKDCMKNPVVKEAYDSLENEFTILNEAIELRKHLKLSQTEIAKRMGLPRSSVNRLESALVAGKMPTLDMLRRYAKALGKRVEIRLV